MRQYCCELEYITPASVSWPIMPFIRFMLNSLAKYHPCLNRKRHLKKLIWKIYIWPCALATCQKFQPHLLLHCENVGIFLWVLLRQLQALSLCRIIPLPNTQRPARADLSLLPHLMQRLCKKNSEKFPLKNLFGSGFMEKNIFFFLPQVVVKPHLQVASGRWESVCRRSTSVSINCTYYAMPKRKATK